MVSFKALLHYTLILIFNIPLFRLIQGTDFSIFVNISGYLILQFLFKFHWKPTFTYQEQWYGNGFCYGRVNILWRDYLCYFWCQCCVITLNLRWWNVVPPKGFLEIMLFLSFSNSSIVRFYVLCILYIADVNARRSELMNHIYAETLVHADNTHKTHAKNLQKYSFLGNYFW